MDDTYVVTYLRDPSGGDAVTVERPAEFSDRWLTVIGGSTPAGTHYETLGRTFHATDITGLAAYLTDWHHNLDRILHEADPLPHAIA
ncbi:hypothetical protein [Streptomyces hydrogenans]|uniref:hypothetical protein n=1 Tax=Streptomyces hydrogenans TaxID=1873719 RepID=UPI003805623C